jgi:hypothetical protein
MTIARGDEKQVRMMHGELWTCTVLGKSKAPGVYAVRWKTGPLRGKKARLGKEMFSR